MPKYRMVAYTVNAEILSPAQRQELLLIRTNISPQPKAGDPECRETARMLSEIKEQMEELHLVDDQGRVVRQSEAAGHTRAEYFGHMDLESFEIMGPERAMFYEFADIKHANGSPNCMSVDGLAHALHSMHADKHGRELTNAFKVADLNGDGEIDLDEFLFAVKIRHGAGFEKGQYFITFETEDPLSEKKCAEIEEIFAKQLAHPLRGKIAEATESVLDVLTFKGKKLSSGEEPEDRKPLFSRLATDEAMIARTQTVETIALVQQRLAQQSLS